MNTVGAAMKASEVPRHEIFLTTKIGDGGLGMGAQDAAKAVCPRYIMRLITVTRTTICQW
jgi:diketogulonate reductase-like aldo/keto reductase